MKSIRLLPIVVAAASALLAFKAIGVVTGSGYLLDGPVNAIAQQAAADTTDPAAAIEPEAAADRLPADAAAGMLAGAANPPPSFAELMSTDPTADAMADQTPAGAGPGAATDAQPAADGTMENADNAGAGDTAATDAGQVQAAEDGEVVAFSDGQVISETDRQILTRLAERRAELDRLSADLDIRAATVEAAELRLNQRIGELTALESEINALLAEKQSRDDNQFASLVTMYEAMKPKDAAAVFDRLGIDILKRVAIAMSPRKMSAILADMTPERAEVLTIALASVDPEPMRDPNAVDLNALPQIVGE